MINIIDRIQSPETAFGKNLRDAVIVGLSGGVVLLLNSIKTVDFGEYNFIAAAVIGFCVSYLNRYTRK